MTKKICISGYYGFDNFGDETILKILIENLKNMDKNAEITVFSSNPQKTASEHNVNSINSFNIIDVIKKLLLCDCLISGGGSLLQDVTSMKSLIYYLFIIETAVIFGKKTIIFAQGIGPINNSILSLITAFLLKKAVYISVRDEKSYLLLKQLKIQSELCSDPVWNIQLRDSQKTNKIGIQIRNFPTVNENFLNILAQNINLYYKDKEIILLSLQNKIDLDICSNFKEILLSINPMLNIKIVENTSNEEIINSIYELNTLIAMRYHACLIAIKSGVKLLPISYDTKVEQLAKEFNLKYIDLKDTSNIQTTFEQFYADKMKYNTEKINKLKYDFRKLKDIIF